MATQPQTRPAETPQLEIVPPPKPLLQQRMSLYDVTNEGVLIEAALIESEGELTPELEQRFDTLLQQGPKAIEAAAGIVRELQASETAAKAEKDRQQKRQAAFGNNADRLRARIRMALDAAFGGKLKTGRFNLWTQKGRDKTTVEYDLLGPTLEHLHHVRPDLVTARTVYEFNSDAALAIWDEERPGREAYRALVAEAERDSEKAAKLPPPPKSRLPEYITVTEMQGDRILQIR